jgi:hypothetical protein
VRAGPLQTPPLEECRRGDHGEQPDPVRDPAPEQLAVTPSAKETKHALTCRRKGKNSLSWRASGRLARWVERVELAPHLVHVKRGAGIRRAVQQAHRARAIDHGDAALLEQPEETPEAEALREERAPVGEQRIADASAAARSDPGPTATMRTPRASHPVRARSN